MRNNIQKIKNLSSFLRDSNNRSSALIASLVVIAFGLFVTGLAVRDQEKEIDKSVMDVAVSRFDDVSSRLASRMNEYDELLSFAGTLHSINGINSKTDWATFVGDLDLKNRLPGTLGIGYAVYLPADSVDEHITSTRQNFYSDYSIRPDTTRDEYTSILFLEPLNKANQSAIGFDMFSNPTRRAAMEKARDTGEASITAPVRLVQEDAIESEQQVGILIYDAVYSRAGVASIEERREYLEAYPYTVLRVGDLVEALLNRTVEDVRFEFKITDEIDGGTTLYQTTDYEQSTTEDNYVSHSGNIQVLDREWRFAINLDSDTVAKGVSPFYLGVAGVIASFVIGFLVLLTITARIKKLEMAHVQDVQRTKDELLALASHQLRTPASAVKQYVGMVTQGFAGEIDSTQRSLLEKAYEANDRQLEIINQLLYVTKADAKQLFVEPSKINVTSLTKSVIEDYQQIASESGATIKLSAKSEIFAEADARFARMVIENLISNAIKYSHKRGKVTVLVKELKQSSEVMIRVSDKGVGIAEEDLEKLFNKFSRLDNELSREVGGSGLGLYLVKELVEAHSGRVTVESELSKGSTFTVFIPQSQNGKSEDSYRIRGATGVGFIGNKVEKPKRK